MRRIEPRERPTERAPSAAFGRAACALALAAALVPGGTGCLGDLVHPTVPAVRYEFATPLSDTIVDIGDTTPPLPCRLTANGVEIGCRLEITVAVGGRFLVERGGRLAANGLGTATVEMSPLNVQSAADSIVRLARVRTVVPRVVWGNPGGADTLTIPREVRLLMALATTKSGQVILGAPMALVQDSGQGVAELVAEEPGWVRALSSGVAVFHAVSDTATSSFRRVVVRLPPLTNPPRSAAPPRPRRP